MWEQLKRITKPNSAIVLFGSQPFTSVLVSSNLGMYKCSWLWEKERPSNFFAAKFVPLNNLEDILVFSCGGTNNGTKNPMKYNPQGLIEIDRVVKNSNTGGKIGKEHSTSLNDGRLYNQKATGYPKRTIKFNQDLQTVHPTQKPIALMEYLIKTYALEGETVLDFTAGSFTTGVACVNLNRKFIMIEKDPYYFKIGSERVERAFSEKGD